MTTGGYNQHNDVTVILKYVRVYSGISRYRIYGAKTSFEGTPPFRNLKDQCIVGAADNDNDITDEEDFNYQPVSPGYQTHLTKCNCQ